jgi:3-oxoacyl-ACP reductase-like protein
VVSENLYDVLVQFPESGGSMIPLDLSGKVALVTGVGDNESFAWFIAKYLNAAGAKIVESSNRF